MALVCSESVSDDLACHAGTDLARAPPQGASYSLQILHSTVDGATAKKCKFRSEEKVFGVSRERYQSTVCRREASQPTVSYGSVTAAHETHP